MDSRRSILHQIKQLNFFLDAKTKREGNAQVLRDQVLSTRVYICLMIAGTLTLAVFAFAAPRTISVTVEKPSVDQYYDLEAKYSATLACPCENTVVPFGSFLSITPVYHQVSIWQRLIRNESEKHETIKNKLHFLSRVC